MIDFATGKIESNRFRSESTSEIESFKKKFVANSIQYNVFHFLNPEMTIGDFLSEEATVSFRQDRTIDKTTIVFTTNTGNCFTDKDLNGIIESLNGQLQFMNTEKMKSWSMPFGTINIMCVWDDGKKFIFEIMYNHWELFFTTWNKWEHIIWSFTKILPSDDFCVYREMVYKNGYDYTNETIQLFATRGKCDNCTKRCTYSKMWGLHNAPTYKELEKEVSKMEEEFDDRTWELKNIKMCGKYKNSQFELYCSNGEYKFSIDGNREDMKSFIDEIDRLAKITSDWYNSSNKF